MAKYGSEIALQTVAVGIWLTFGLFHIFSVVESLGTQFISVGEYIVSYASLLGGFGIIASMIAWMSPAQNKKRKGSYAKEIWAYGSVWRTSVWPPLIWSFFVLILTVCYASVLTHRIGFYTRPPFSLAIDILGPTDAVTSFHLFSAIFQGMVFFGAIPALSTFFSASTMRYQKIIKNGDLTYVVLQNGDS